MSIFISKKHLIEYIEIHYYYYEILCTQLRYQNRTKENIKYLPLLH